MLLAKAFRLPFYFPCGKMKRSSPPASSSFFFFSFSSSVARCSLLAPSFAMASLTPPPWRLKIVTSLATRLLVPLEDPAATVGELRGKNKRFQDATDGFASGRRRPTLAMCRGNRKLFRAPLSCHAGDWFGPRMAKELCDIPCPRNKRISYVVTSSFRGERRCEFVLRQRQPRPLSKTL